MAEEVVTLARSMAAKHRARNIMRIIVTSSCGLRPHAVPRGTRSRSGHVRRLCRDLPPRAALCRRPDCSSFESSSKGSRVPHAGDSAFSFSQAGGRHPGTGGRGAALASSGTKRLPTRACPRCARWRSRKARDHRRRRWLWRDSPSGVRADHTWAGSGAPAQSRCGAGTGSRMDRIGLATAAQGGHLSDGLSG